MRPPLWCRPQSLGLSLSVRRGRRAPLPRYPHHSCTEAFSAFHLRRFSQSGNMKPLLRTTTHQVTFCTMFISSPDPYFNHK